MTLERNKLGKTGIEVTELCYGTLTLGELQARVPVDEGAAAIRSALELGVNFIDTAKTYGTYSHVRNGIAGLSDIVVASKSPVRSGVEMRTDVEACLRELDRDVIDIFHLHFVRSKQDMREREDALHALVKCREAGMIRAIGLSAHGVEGLRCSLTYPEIEVAYPLVNKSGLGIIDRDLEGMLSAIRDIHDTGRGLYAMKPLGGGHFIDDIPGAVGYLRDIGMFHSISVGLKDVEEAEVMVGVFDGDSASIERALAMGRERRGRKHLIIYDFLCEQCGRCVDECGQAALTMGAKVPAPDYDKCVLCGYCAAVCPRFAIRVI